MIVIIVFAALVAVFVSAYIAYIHGYDAGRLDRAIEDKAHVIEASLAQARAEQSADIHRRRSLALLRAIDSNR